MLCLCSCALQQASGVARDVYPEKRILSTSGGLAEEDVFQALAKIDFKTVDASYHVRAALVLRRPGYVRLEVLPLIGNPDLLLTATPDTMTVFVPSKKSFTGDDRRVPIWKNFYPGRWTSKIWSWC